MPEQMQQPPVDQDGYNIFVAQGYKVISAIGDKLKGKSSIDQLGNTLFEVVDKVQTEGAKNGVDFGLDVILHGSNEILGRMLQAAQVQINEEQIKQVIGIAVGRWVQNAIKTGKMTPEELQGLAQQGQQSLQAQQGQEPMQAQQPPQPQGV